MLQKFGVSAEPVYGTVHTRKNIKLYYQQDCQMVYFHTENIKNGDLVFYDHLLHFPRFGIMYSMVREVLFGTLF
jgi:hypothetical protein